MAPQLAKKSSKITELPLSTVLPHRYKKSQKVATPPLASKHLLDHVRVLMHHIHYSLNTNN
jgi:hypothetical protein